MSNTNSVTISEADGSYISAPHIAAYNVSNITVECWVYRPSSDVTNKQRGLIDKGRDGYGGWSLRLDNSTTSSSGAPQKATWGCRISGSNRYVVASGTYPQDTWFHLAATYNGSAMKIYQDGVLVGTTTVTGTLGTTSIAISAGRFNDGANASIDCKVDEVRVWNVERTVAQIDDNKSVQLVGNETGLILYSKLNNSYTDETSNSNNFTGTASPVFTTDVPFGGGGGLPANNALAFGGGM